MVSTVFHSLASLAMNTTAGMKGSSSNASIGASSNCSSASTSTGNNKTSKILLKSALPANFTPGPYTVICGRGRKAQESIGNRRLGVLAQLFIPRYSKATRKDEKSKIVTEIVKMVQQACDDPEQAFVRQVNDIWWEVDNLHAREKVGTVLRDLLSEKYKSSTKSKLVRRKERREKHSQFISNSSFPCNISQQGSESILRGIELEMDRLFQP